MPQIIFLLILAAGGWLLYRKFVADAERVRQRSQQVRKESETGAMGTLVKDPKTGEYHVKRD